MQRTLRVLAGGAVVGHGGAHHASVHRLGGPQLEQRPARGVHRRGHHARRVILGVGVVRRLCGAGELGGLRDEHEPGHVRGVQLEAHLAVRQHRHRREVAEALAADQLGAAAVVVHHDVAHQGARHEEAGRGVQVDHAGVGRAAHNGRAHGRPGVHVGD